jgi:putative DNA primase/helicase
MEPINPAPAAPTPPNGARGAARREFYSALHPDGTTTCVCTFRTGGPPAYRFVKTATDAARAAAELGSAPGIHGVYACVPSLADVPREGRGCEADALDCRACWVDLDALDFEPLRSTRQRLVDEDHMSAKEAKEQAWRRSSTDDRAAAMRAAADSVEAAVAANLLPPPTAVVRSGRGWHYYWLLDEAAPTEDLALVKGCNRRIAESTGGDHAIDLARVLRFPGTVHAKDPGEPILCDLESWHPERLYTLQQLIDMLDAQPEPLRPRKSECGASGHGRDPCDHGPTNGTKLTAPPDRGAASTLDAWELILERSPRAQAAWVGAGYSDRSSPAMTLCNIAIRSGVAATECDLLAILAAAPSTAEWLREKPGAAERTAAKALAEVVPGGEEDRNSHGHGSSHGHASRPALPRATRLYACTDTGNAERLVDSCGPNLCYCHTWRHWLIYAGGRWIEDVSGVVQRAAKRVVRHIRAEAALARELAEKAAATGNLAAADPAADPGGCAGAGGSSTAKRGSAPADPGEAFERHATRSESARARRDMIALAESEPTIAVVPEAFDVSRWDLNVANGTIDLRTGVLRPHSRDDWISRLAPVAYDPAAKAPRWAAFIHEIMGGDGELAAYLQRFLGYCLTGATQEQIAGIWYGEGANGKSTLLGVLREILGDYAAHAAADSFMSARRDGSPRDDLVGLRGSRLVTCIETRDDQTLDEEFLKTVTGDDPVRCRPLYGRYFEFIPRFKPILATNHYPRIRSTGYAIWRRLHLVPFAQKYVKPEELEKHPGAHLRDEKLGAALRTELPGILAWLVAGCQHWQRHGLLPPPTVRAATESYRSDMDTLGEFFTERCVMIPDARAKATDLYAAYRMWAIEQSGGSDRHVMAQQRFGREVRARGMVRVKQGVNWWLGVAVRP